MFSLDVAKTACNICRLSKNAPEKFNIPFFRPPKDKAKMQRWLEALNLGADTILPDSVLICGRHFRPSMFKRLGGDVQRLRLNDDAYPCLLELADYNRMVSYLLYCKNDIVKCCFSPQNV